MTSTQARIEIDLDTFQLRKDGRYIHLTRIEWALLRELIQHKGQALSHDHLLQKAWGSGYENEDNYVHIYIAKLRKNSKLTPRSLSISSPFQVSATDGLSPKTLT